MEIHVKVDRPRWLRLPRRRSARFALVLGAALVVAVPLAWASHLFTDVPTSSPHHDDISAIAGAGITTGCAPGLYCPADAVRRDQMASFIRRSAGRVGLGGLFTAAVPTTETPAWKTTTITPGNVSGTGFIKADATITVRLDVVSSCPCRYRAALFITGVGYMVPLYTDVTLWYAGQHLQLAMSGAIAVPAGAKTVEIRLFRATGGGTAVAYGNVTTTYFPFGRSGTNILGATGSGSGPNATG